jgi:hypothetical protein
MWPTQRCERVPRAEGCPRTNEPPMRMTQGKLGIGAFNMCCVQSEVLSAPRDWCCRIRPARRSAT